MGKLISTWPILLMVLSALLPPPSLVVAKPLAHAASDTPKHLEEPKLVLNFSASQPETNPPSLTPLPLLLLTPHFPDLPLSPSLTALPPPPVPSPLPSLLPPSPPPST